MEQYMSLQFNMVTHTKVATLFLTNDISLFDRRNYCYFSSVLLFIPTSANEQQNGNLNVNIFIKLRNNPLK